LNSRTRDERVKRRTGNVKRRSSSDIRRTRWTLALEDFADRFALALEEGH